MDLTWSHHVLGRQMRSHLITSLILKHISFDFLMVYAYKRHSNDFAYLNRFSLVFFIPWDMTDGMWHFFIQKPHTSQLWRRGASAIARHLANLSKDPPNTFVNVSARGTQLFKINCSKVLPSASKLSIYIMCRPRPR